jgi:hypothetical protein
LLQILELGHHEERGRITEEVVSWGPGWGVEPGAELESLLFLHPSAAAVAGNPGAAGIWGAV